MLVYTPANTPAFNSLSPAEAERLALLLEELGETQQAIGKILRHGYESTNPLIPNSPTNRQALQKELGDVRCAIGFLTQTGDLQERAIQESAKLKKVTAQKWLHHQKENQEPNMTDTAQAHIERMITMVENPAHWIQNTFAEDASGFSVPPGHSGACRWCQLGASSRVEHDVCVRDRADGLVNAVAISMGYPGSVQLNDFADHATVMEMLYIALEHANGAEV